METKYKTIYLREGQYTLSKLQNELYCCPDAGKLIDKLKEFGILRRVSKKSSDKDISELADADYVVTDTKDDDVYDVKFVGVVIVDSVVLICYPKYLPHQAPSKEAVCKIFRVLAKYNNSAEQNLNMFDENTDGMTNLLTVMLFLLLDYFENGIYDNSKQIIETNGSGEIFWDKTINETFALLKNNRPYYTELKTRKTLFTIDSYFARLHKCVLNEISRDLSESGVSELLGIPEIMFDEEERNCFGETEYILYRLENELKGQFNTRKQHVLQALHSYIKCENKYGDTDAFCMYGTNAFNMVWEKVCSEVFNNKLNTSISAIPEIYDKLQEKPDKKLINIIDKPVWHFENISYDKVETLKPDIVCIESDKFIILDAKYYLLKNDGNTISGNPGIESITKQFLYNLAFRKYFDGKNISMQFENYFVFPKFDESPKVNTTVSFDIFKNEPLKLPDIKAIFIEPKKLYELYLNNERVSFSKFIKGS